MSQYFDRPSTPRVNPTQGVSMMEMLDAICDDLETLFRRIRELEEKTADANEVCPLFHQVKPTVTRFKQLRHMSRARTEFRRSNIFHLLFSR